MNFSAFNPLKQMKLAAAFLYALTSGMAFAGPNAAVFCKEIREDGSARILRAYDIARKDGAELFEIDGEHDQLPGGLEHFSLKSGEHLEAHLVAFSQSRADVAYTNELQQRPILLANDDSKLGRIVKFVFVTNQTVTLPSIGRTGEVLIQLQEGIVTKLHFKNCRYEGALVGTWSSMWGIE